VHRLSEVALPLIMVVKAIQLLPREQRSPLHQVPNPDDDDDDDDE
jgi:hypothetical protein